MRVTVMATRYSVITLGEFPDEWIELACRKCPRRGRLRREKLLAEYGPDITMPDLRLRIANCEKVGDFSDYCGVYYLNPSDGWRR